VKSVENEESDDAVDSDSNVEPKSSGDSKLDSSSVESNDVSS